MTSYHRTRFSTLTILLAIAACEFPEEGTGQGASSSGFTDSDNGTDPSSVTTTATVTGPGTSDPSDASSSEDGGTTEDDTDPTFGESATTTHGESSTGEPSTDFALSFVGDSHAKSADPVSMTAVDYTVETWIEFSSDDATGIILDQQDAGFTNGWSLYVHPEWHALVFSFFDGEHANQIAVGPSVAEIGVGWHHIAATKDGDALYLHVDGVGSAPTTVSDTMSQGDIHLTIGANLFAPEVFTLQGAVIDDLRISSFPRYADDFDPPVVFDAEDPESIDLLLSLDEGAGVSASDDLVSEIVFVVSSPAWVPGHEG